VVLDTLAQWPRYASLHPALTRAFQFLTGPTLTRLASAPAGVEEHRERHAIDGDRLYVSIDRVQGRGRERSRLEAHRRYIDIQLTIEGLEEIGWKPLADCTRPDGQFNEAKDVGFFSDRPESWLSLPAGHFAIFFPNDAHAPLAGGSRLIKAIMKIALE
jgi:YhcH/YjgK/YiaL family protein